MSNCGIADGGGFDLNEKGTSVRLEVPLLCCEDPATLDRRLVRTSGGCYPRLKLVAVVG